MSASSAEKLRTKVKAFRVFISYARKDGSEVAHNLRDKLSQAGCDVWLDTDRIAGGASWSKAIEDALNSCDSLIAVISEGSYISEICRAEQMWALEHRKPIIPILASRGAPRPLHLFTLHYRTFPISDENLLADLNTELPAEVCLPPARYDTVPPLPRPFLSRDDAVSALRDILFAEGEETKIGISAVAGMGGIGKTVLATVLCRDAAVQRAFPDGIAWINMGREWDGNVVVQMRELGRALGEDVERGWDTKVGCENSYRTLLRKKAALIVVDDVWNAEHLKPFSVDDAPRSRLLFTTRDAGIARALTDRAYSAHALANSEARELLARSSANSEQNLPPEAEDIIKSCAGLPLAIAQVGASLRRLPRVDWQDTQSALQKADIQTIQERLPSGQQSFFKSLAVSIQALPDQMQMRYLKLAVLLEDMSAPLPLLRTLWNVDEAESRHSARYLVERSLAFWEAADDPVRGIKLHDLQLDYVRACFPDSQTLNLIHEAVRLSTHILQADPLQFASQLTARLLPHRGFLRVSEFLADLIKGALKPWVRALHPALHPPGTALLRTLSGHLSWVSDVALTADGQRAVSASHDHTLKVWDLESGRELRTIIGHASRVHSVVLTPDGRRAVSASGDHTLKVWDLESGHDLSTLSGHADDVYGVAVTADGRRAVSASGDHTLKVWDLENGHELSTLSGHTHTVSGVALTADCLRAVSASYDHTLKVWDLESGRELRTLSGHTSRVCCVALMPDGQRAVSASYDQTLKVWDLESGRELRELSGHSFWVTSVALTWDGQRAVSASWDNTLKVWDLLSGCELLTLRGHSGGVASVTLTADGLRAFSASQDGTLKVWDLSARNVRTPMSHTSQVTSVVLTADGQRAVSASHDRTLKVWDLESGLELRTLSGHTSRVVSVALTADDRHAVSASTLSEDGNQLRVWDLESGRELPMSIPHSEVTSVALTSDGRRAVTASQNNKLKVWDLESWHECGWPRDLHTLAGHTSSVSSVALTPDGRRAISASWDHTLKVWDLESGRELRTLTGHTSSVNGVAVTADGQRAISASWDHTLKVWDLESGRELRTLTGHTSGLNGVAVTADGQRAISASSDYTLKVWDMESGFCIATFYADGSVECCAVHHQTIVAGDAAGRLYFLTLEGID